MKRDQESATETYIYEKRPVYNKRDLRMGKETCIYENNPGHMKRDAIYEKYPIYMKSVLYI